VLDLVAGSQTTFLVCLDPLCQFPCLYGARLDVQVESQLTFAGMAIFQAPLKPGSVPALRALADSSHQLVMITGDTALTACHTAAQVHIVDRPVAILTSDVPEAVTGAHTNEYFP
jgi:magnesium-transporting ATPase (P-type)